MQCRLIGLLQTLLTTGCHRQCSANCSQVTKGDRAFFIRVQLTRTLDTHSTKLAFWHWKVLFLSLTEPASIFFFSCNQKQQLELEQLHGDFERLRSQEHQKSRQLEELTWVSSLRSWPSFKHLAIWSSGGELPLQIHVFLFFFFFFLSHFSQSFIFLYFIYYPLTLWLCLSSHRLWPFCFMFLGQFPFVVCFFLSNPFCVSIRRSFNKVPAGCKRPQSTLTFAAYCIRQQMGKPPPPSQWVGQPVYAGFVLQSWIIPGWLR